jgi:hypothetical protein
MLPYLLLAVSYSPKPGIAKTLQGVHEEFHSCNAAMPGFWFYTATAVHQGQGRANKRMLK